MPTHDGSLEIGGAVHNPATLTLDELRALPAFERAVTLECAGNGRLATRPLPIGEPWGDYAVSTSRWTGALLSDVLEQAQPAAEGVEVRFEGADRGPYHLAPVLPETNREDLAFVRTLALEHATDPAAEILIAYEMNGQPLTPDHGAPFRLVVPHWYAVASVKWLKRIDVLTEPYVGEFQTGHYIYEWPDRARTRHPDARPRPHHRPRPRRDDRSWQVHRARKGVVGQRTGNRGPRQLHRRRRLAPGEARAPEGSVPMAGLVVRLGARPTSADTLFAPEQRMRPATCNPTSRPGTDSATGTTQSRSPTSTSANADRRRRAAADQASHHV